LKNKAGTKVQATIRSITQLDKNNRYGHKNVFLDKILFEVYQQLQM